MTSRWLSDALIFAAGFSAGMLTCMISDSLRASDSRRSGSANNQILSRLRERGDDKILQAAVRTTEDIRNELSRSLQSLREIATEVLDPRPDPPDAENAPAASFSRSKPNS
jgi:hypothetical protein